MKYNKFKIKSDFLPSGDQPKAIKQTYGFVSAGWNVVPLAAKIVNILINK